MLGRRLDLIISIQMAEWVGAVAVTDGALLRPSNQLLRRPGAGFYSIFTQRGGGA